MGRRALGDKKRNNRIEFSLNDDELVEAQDAAQRRAMSLTYLVRKLLKEEIVRLDERDRKRAERREQRRAERRTKRRKDANGRQQATE